MKTTGRILAAAFLGLAVWSCVGWAGTTNPVPFTDDFEAYPDLTPLDRGTNGWYGSSSQWFLRSLIIVQTNTVRTGTNAAMIPTGCTLSNRFVSTTPTNVWIQMDMVPVWNDDFVTNYLEVDTDMALMFYVNSNGNFVVHNGIATNTGGLPDPTNSVNWVVVPGFTVPTNFPTWVRINIYEDFTKTNCDLYANGIPLMKSIGFINTNLTNFTGFSIYNDGIVATSYLDNVSVVSVATNEVTQLPLIVVPSALSQNLYANLPESVYPLVQTVKVINVWSTDIGFQVRTNRYWVTALPTNGTVTNGTTQDVVLTYADTMNWAAGVSNATVTVVATNGAAYWGTQTVQVVLNMIALSNVLYVTPTQFINTVWKGAGAKPTNRTFVVQNRSDMSYPFDYRVAIAPEASWIVITDSSSTGALDANAVTNLTLTNTVDTADWTAGTCSNTWVDVVASNSGFMATQRVYVAVNVSNISDVLMVTPTYFTNTAWIGDKPTNQTLVVSNMSDASFVYGVSTSDWWISVSPTSGTCAAQNTSTVTLAYRPTWAWTAGMTSNATAIVSSVNGGGAIQYVAVALTIENPASNYYVATNGGNTSPYTNWAMAARTLTAAVYKANYYTNLGTVVWLSNGVHNLPNQVTLSNVTVRGANGATNVTLNGGNFRGFYLAHTGAVLNGLTITGCNIKGKGTTNGGAVFVSTGLVVNCQLLKNSTTNGGGVAVGAGGIVRGCLIWGNTATNGGGVYYVGSGLVESCTIASNYAVQYGGGLYTFTNMTGLCVNAVVYQNLVGAGAGSSYSNWGTNINAGIMFSNCCVSPTDGIFGVYGGGNITNDPSFVGIANGNCRLNSGSLCINAGTNQAWMTNALDLVENIRICSTQVDMGAYELQPLIVVPSALSQSLYADAQLSVALNIQTVQVSNAGSAGDIGFQVETNQYWVTANPQNGTIAAGDTLDVLLTYTNTAGWAEGVSNATVTVVASTDGSGSKTVQVALNVIALSNVFYVTPTQFIDTVWKGGKPTNRPFKVQNLGDLSFSNKVETNIFWIASLSNNDWTTLGAYGTNTLTLTNTVSTVDWMAGTTSNAIVTVTATNSDAGVFAVQTVAVYVSVLDIANVLWVAPTNLTNAAWTGDAPTNQTFVVSNMSDASFVYSVTNQASWSWITNCSPTGGTIAAHSASNVTLMYGRTANWIYPPSSQAWVRVMTDGGGATQYVMVTVNITNFNDGTLQVYPLSLTDTVWLGDKPTNQTFQVWNAGPLSFVYNVQTTAVWITASPTTGTCAAQGTITVTNTFRPTWGWTVGQQSNATAIVSSVNGGGLAQYVAVALTIENPALNYYVATNGTDTTLPYTYTNWATAAKTLTAAVYKANYYTNLGTVVWLSNGVHNLPNQVTLSNVTVCSLNGATNVMLNGGVFRGFHLMHTGAVLNGLTITNCNARIGTNGGAVFVSTGLVVNCRLLMNSATNGGGVAVGARGVVRGCLIWGNTATNGGGVYFVAGTNGLVESCTIASNYAVQYGGGLYTATSTTGLCVNVVVYQNLVGEGAGSSYSNWGTNVGAALMFTNSCVGQPVGIFGANSLTNIDPLFVNVTNGDCRLTRGSLCINAGANQAWMTNALDLAGNIRVRFSRVDIGAYEWYPYQGMGIKVNGVPYERIKLINDVEPLWINGITNSI